MDAAAVFIWLSHRIVCGEQSGVEDKEISEPLLGFAGYPISGMVEVSVGKTHVRRDRFRISIPYVEIVHMVGDHNFIMSEAWVTRLRNGHHSNSERRPIENCSQVSPEIPVSNNPLTQSTSSHCYGYKSGDKDQRVQEVAFNRKYGLQVTRRYGR